MGSKITKAEKCEGLLVSKLDFNFSASQKLVYYYEPSFSNLTRKQKCSLKVESVQLFGSSFAIIALCFICV